MYILVLPWLNPSICQQRLHLTILCLSIIAYFFLYLNHFQRNVEVIPSPACRWYLIINRYNSLAKNKKHRNKPANVAVVINREELKLAALQQEGISKAAIEGRIRSERDAIRIIEESITKNITALVTGDSIQLSWSGLKAQKPLSMNGLTYCKDPWHEKLQW